STSTPTSGNAVVYGWGAVNADTTGFFAPLQTATLAIQPPGDCGAAFPSGICAGLTTPHLSIGDSGRPVPASTPTGHDPAGVISGILSPVGQPTTCGADSSGFTDVALFTTWIDTQLASFIPPPRAPGIAGAAIVNGAIGAQLVTNGAPVTVTAQYGLDT